MKNIVVKLKQAEQITITPLADLHIGDRNADIDLIKRRIENIKADPNAYAILDGDLINNETKTSVSNVYDAEMNPTEQIRYIVELLKPIKGRILAAVPGNHELRSYSKGDGIDITSVICDQLGISNRYSPETALLSLSIGKVHYKIHITHGSGGGRKLGGKANRLVELSDIVEGCDIHLQGHTHTPLVTRRTIMSEEGGKLEQREILYVNTAAALSFGGYGEIQGFAPTSTINPTIYLSGTKRFAWAVL